MKGIVWCVTYLAGSYPEHRHRNQVHQVPLLPKKYSELFRELNRLRHCNLQSKVFSIDRPQTGKSLQNNLSAIKQWITFRERAVTKEFGCEQPTACGCPRSWECAPVPGTSRRHANGKIYIRVPIAIHVYGCTTSKLYYTVY